MGKVFHRLYTIEVKGDSSVLGPIDDMIESVTDALVGSYPRTRVKGTRHQIVGERTIMVPLWPPRARRIIKEDVK